MLFSSSLLLAVVVTMANAASDLISHALFHDAVARHLGRLADYEKLGFARDADDVVERDGRIKQTIRFVSNDAKHALDFTARRPKRTLHGLIRVEMRKTSSHWSGTPDKSFASDYYTHDGKHFLFRSAR